MKLRTPFGLVVLLAVCDCGDRRDAPSAVKAGYDVSKVRPGLASVRRELFEKTGR